MGPYTDKSKKRIAGYLPTKTKSIAYVCQDRNCDFHSKRLPIYVIDEDIYEIRPTFLVGTIDKFTQLAWNHDVRKIFGINENGDREFSPPSLIIQDELHLITGPLGSIAGIYEGVVEELCKDVRNPKMPGPKIICSTATIKMYKNQIKSLYARDKKFSKLFPPHGISIDDNFFSTYAKNSEGKYDKPKYFVGINTTVIGSMQKAQVDIYANLLQSVNFLSKEERDPWYTLLCFFNRIKDVGYTETLLQNDIPSKLKLNHQRKNIKRELQRYINPNDYIQLTGNSSNEEVWDAIRKLNIEYKEIIKDKDDSKNKKQIDYKEKALSACLASNIIEVGVDIPRLSLITVLAQPKSTSTYIQVTGRIGREWKERPGLVITIYAPRRQRDRSHYEQFRSYHERLYSHVEPTSVTPFARPVLERALHATLVSYVRQYGSIDNIQNPIYDNQNISNLIKEFFKIYEKRLKTIDEDQIEILEEIFNRRINEWERFEPQEWSKGNNKLLNYAGTFTSERFVWETPIAMRNVDAKCKASITDKYIKEEE